MGLQRGRHDLETKQEGQKRCSARMDTREHDSTGRNKGAPGTKSDRPGGVGEKGRASGYYMKHPWMGTAGPQA